MKCTGTLTRPNKIVLDSFGLVAKGTDCMIVGRKWPEQVFIGCHCSQPD